MSNHEERSEANSLHLLMAFSRSKDGQEQKCIRSIIKDYNLDLELLKAKLKIIGGSWRIHKTVNARDVEKARKSLIKTLIDHPEKAGYIDSQWRTELLQRDCIYGEKSFLLDIDTLNDEDIALIERTITDSGGEIKESIRTPNGLHFVTNPFDTRIVCALKNVTLLRDGYIYVDKVEGR